MKSSSVLYAQNQHDDPSLWIRVMLASYDPQMLRDQGRGGRA